MKKIIAPAILIVSLISYSLYTGLFSHVHADNTTNEIKSLISSALAPIQSTLSEQGNHISTLQNHQNINENNLAKVSNKEEDNKSKILQLQNTVGLNGTTKQEATIIASLLDPIRKNITDLQTQQSAFSQTLGIYNTDFSSINQKIGVDEGKLSDLQTHQTQDEQQLATLNQQVQTLSNTIKSIPTSTKWDVTGQYNFQLATANQKSIFYTINITSFDTTTGQFNGTGQFSFSGDSGNVTVNGTIDNSQLYLHIQSDGYAEADIEGAIAPNGKLWGVDSNSFYNDFPRLITTSGAAKKL